MGLVRTKRYSISVYLYLLVTVLAVNAANTTDNSTLPNATITTSEQATESTATTVTSTTSTTTTTVKTKPPPTTTDTTITSITSQPPSTAKQTTPIDPPTSQEQSTTESPSERYRNPDLKSASKIDKPAPFPDPKSRVPVIIQEAGRQIPELVKILNGTTYPDATQLWNIYQYIMDLKNLDSTPKSTQDFIKDLENSHLFEFLLTTPTPNVTQIPTTQSPFTHWWVQCADDMVTTINAFFSREIWALKMFDASGKPGHSILEGNTKFFGNYKECAETESGPRVNQSRVEGNICRLSFDLDIDETLLPMSKRIEWDLCVPKSCEGSDLTLLAKKTLVAFSEISRVEVICTKNLDLYQDVGAISAIVILGILCLLVMGGTLLDLALAVESDGEENYVINAYDMAPSRTPSVSAGLEVKKRTPPPVARKPRPPSKVNELKGVIGMELQNISPNGRGPSIHGGIGQPVMGFRGASHKRQYQSDVIPDPDNTGDTDQIVEEQTEFHHISSNGRGPSINRGMDRPVMGYQGASHKRQYQSDVTPEPAVNTSRSYVNPAFMPGEDAIGSSDTGSVVEFSPGGKDEDDDDNVKDNKKDSTDLLPRWKQLIVAFSIPRNMKKILGVKASPGSIRCIHGIRVLSMAWVILGHTYDSILKTFQNPTVSKGLISTMRGQIIYNAPFAVDTFFLISGLLTAYLIMKECGRWKRVPGKTGIMYYVHRFWRLTPPYLLWIMVVATLLQYVGEGRPAWRDYDMADRCRDNWWTNLLYINNIYRTKDMCLTSSWYLASDMQFHVIAPLALIPWIFGYRVIGFVVSGLMVALHIASNIWLQLDLDGADMTRNRQDYIYDIFVQPYTRVAPYALGLMMGWYLWKCKTKLRMNKYIAMVGWLLCIAILLTLTLVTYDKNKDLQPDDNRWSSTGITVYETLSRPLWGLVVAWTVVACATGNGGFINSFLSWGGWLPLSRLTYCVYIVHATVISFEEVAVESVMFFTETLMVYRFFGFLVMSYLVGLILSLVAESPLIAVERALISKSQNWL